MIALVSLSYKKRSSPQFANSALQKNRFFCTFHVQAALPIQFNKSNYFRESCNLMSFCPPGSVCGSRDTIDSESKLYSPHGTAMVYTTGQLSGIMAVIGRLARRRQAGAITHRARWRSAVITSSSEEPSGHSQFFCQQKARLNILNTKGNSFL